jgi:hypothetical protein
MRENFMCFYHRKCSFNVAKIVRTYFIRCSRKEKHSESETAYKARKVLWLGTLKVDSMVRGQLPILPVLFPPTQNAMLCTRDVSPHPGIIFIKILCNVSRSRT